MISLISILNWNRVSKSSVKNIKLSENYPTFAQWTIPSLSTERVHFQIKGYPMYLFIFILFGKEIPVSKQRILISDAAFCDVWSGSTLFACVP